MMPGHLTEQQASVSSTFQPCHYHRPTDIRVDLLPIKSKTSISPFYFGKQHKLLNNKKFPRHILQLGAKICAHNDS